MIYLLTAIVFILSVAITIGGVLLVSHMRTTYKTGFFSTLLFSLVFYFTFGFYAAWGQMISRTFLGLFIPASLLPGIANGLVVLGSPFLIFASLMYIRFAREVSGYDTRNSFNFLYLLINLLSIAAIILIAYKYKRYNLQTLIRYYFIALNLLSVGYGSYTMFIVSGKKPRLGHADMSRFSAGLILLSLVQNALFMVERIHVILSLAFILFFYISGGYIPFYFRYRADLSGLLVRNENTASFEQFCSHYAVSPREKEIIREICQGLTNQQIADKLFISLQTVKDHTHRIYGKTECNSRSMLIRMVSEHG